MPTVAAGRRDIASKELAHRPGASRWSLHRYMVEPRIYIGIDPGAKGAVAAITRGGEVLLLSDLPFCTDRQLDCLAFQRLLATLPAIQSVAVLERAECYGVPAYSALKLGAVYGALRALLYASGAEVCTPTASSWKRACGLTWDKSYSVIVARGLFQSLPRVLRHDKAEALLLADYARSLHQ